MSFPRYPEYKDSGVEWLGEVPGHWEVRPLKHLARLTTGMTPPTDDRENYDASGFPWIRPEDLDESGAITKSSKFLSEKGKALAREVQPGASLICCIGTIGKVGIVDECVSTNQQITAAKFSGSDRFFYLVTCAARTEFEITATGNVLKILNTERLGEVKYPVPPLVEQTAIATFLDRETAKIDALVAEQEKLIALLQEKRQAVISHAVTKGLDPNVPMKDSGVEWLGEVPGHWEVRSISSISTKITNGYVGPTRDILVDDGVRYLQSLHIKRNKIRFDQPYFVREDWSLVHSKSILEAGDVLIVQTGDIGQVAVVPPEFAGCNCHALIIVSPIRDVLSGNWLSSVLNSDYGLHSLLSIQTGALHPHLNCGNVKFLVLPVPPRHEQDAIQNYIEERTKRFDALIDEAEVAINLLQERRTALISAAVTGQIDVRGWEPAKAVA